MADDCSQNIDSLKLVREGTSQDARYLPALDPSSAPANARSIADSIVFARDYASLLKHYDANNNPTPDGWPTLFGADVAVPLAVASVEDIAAYQAALREWFDFLNDPANTLKKARLRERLGYLYDSIATLARALDWLAQTLPAGMDFKATLQNLIRTQLAPELARLIAYYKAGETLNLVSAVVPAGQLKILGQPFVKFVDVLSGNLSTDWSAGAAWSGYIAGILPDASVYGPAGAVFTQINHCSTNNLFRSVFDQFLKVFSRVVADAQQALQGTLTDWDGHQPHYALFLAFLQLFEYARAAGNTLTQRHLDFYFRTILGLQEKAAEPGQVFLLAELAKQSASRDFTAGELFKAGKDGQGNDAFFSNAADFVANKAQVAALKSLYRHGTEPVDSSSLDQGRIYASPVANSDDGLGAPLTSADLSWDPFFNKVYTDGALSAIKMPEAEIGFAVASHYLLMGEGQRWIYAPISVSGYAGPVTGADYKDDIRCFVTTDKGWLEKPAQIFAPGSPDMFYLLVELTGADPAAVPYSQAVHGYTFDTDLPMLLVKLKQDDTRRYAYSSFDGVTVSKIDLNVVAAAVKTLAASNDFGPVDPSKPFQPFGPSPVAGSSLVIGSKEIFQKSLVAAWINVEWRIPPAMYPSSSAPPTAGTYFLNQGSWVKANLPAASIAPNSGPDPLATTFALNADLDKPVLDEPDFSANEYFGTQSRQGFVRLSLSGNFGQDTYQSDLIKYLKGVTTTQPPSTPPGGPTASALTMGYWATTTLDLTSGKQAAFDTRPGQFFHLAPFGTAERHPYLSGGDMVSLFPEFAFALGNKTLDSEAEFYIGIAGLAPPQNLSLLFQVSDGTADPLALKPVPHIGWSYLRENRWVAFGPTQVQDGTGEWLQSGIVTLSVPADAGSDNTYLPSGLFWIRAAVHEKSEAVCRFQLAAAQALRAVFSNRGNAPGFSATPLAAGTISKLATPDAAVKSISQPYASFGGRGAEEPQDFYVRVSERLRHKDRAIDLWDYEHLILEAFPQIYKVKCLNHTCYEPSDSGLGIYRELAPGHVTVVTIPDLQGQQQRDPLKPYTSLGLLQDIEAFLSTRTNCFTTLHVKNPQFEDVRLSFSLRLFPGFDEAYYTQLLQQSITRFLSPWAFSGTGSPSFGGKVYKSVLINFVEQQPYVDYVTDFKVFRDIGGVSGSADLDEVTGSTAVSILVSAPASRHKIALIDDEQVSALAESCLCEA